jgi:hypothetical protein
MARKMSFTGSTFVGLTFFYPILHPMPSLDYSPTPNLPEASKEVSVLNPRSPVGGVVDTRQFQAGYGRRRYQFVLARVLFCGLEYVNPQTSEVERIFFYKDGSVGVEGVQNELLSSWASNTWASDYNVAFWQIYAAARALMLTTAGYNFTYDAGLGDLLSYLD